MFGWVEERREEKRKKKVYYFFTLPFCIKWGAILEIQMLYCSFSPFPLIFARKVCWSKTYVMNSERGNLSFLHYYFLSPISPTKQDERNQFLYHCSFLPSFTPTKYGVSILAQQVGALPLPESRQTLKCCATNLSMVCHFHHKGC